MDIVFHHIRVGRCNHHFTFFVDRFFISIDHYPVQGLQNIPVWRMGGGQAAVVVNIHIGVGDVTDGDQSLQLLMICDRKSHHPQCPHHIPGFFQGNLTGDSLGLSNLNVPDIRHHILHILGRRYLKIIQHILRLLIDLPGAGRTVSTPAQTVFQLRVGDCGTNGIRIRILMTDHIDRCCLCRHTILLCFPVFCSHFSTSCLF